MAGELNDFYSRMQLPDRATSYVPMGSDNPDDAVYLKEYAEVLKQHQQFLNEMEEDSKFYTLRFGGDFLPKDWAQDGFEATLPPTGSQAVEAAANHILTTPDIMIPERPDEPDMLIEQEIASIKTAGLLYFWHQVFKQGDPLGHGKKDVIKYGKIVLKKEILPEALAPKGVTVGGRKFPWRVRQISPGQVFEIGDPYDPICVYEAYEMSRVEAERLFPEARGEWRQNKESLDKVRVLEYWEKPRETSRGKRIIWIDDERVLSKFNPYSWVDGYTDSGQETYCGYVPYFIADSGWGDGDVDAAPHERYVGMLRRIHSLLLAQARQLTAAESQLRITSFPPIVATGIPQDDEHPIKLRPGAVIHLQDDTQKIGTLQWAKMEPAIFQMLAQTHAYINEISQFEQLSGIPQTGVDSATEADQNMRAASSKLAGVLAGLKSLIMRMNETVLQDIQYIFEDAVSLYGAVEGMPGSVVIRPEWIDGFFENYVELKTSDTRQLNQANAMFWAQMHAQFRLDRRYAMKKAGIENPPQRITQRQQEDVWDDPRSHEIRYAATMGGAGGEMGMLLATSAVNALAAGQVPNMPQATASGNTPADGAPGAAEGQWAGPPTGQPSARQDPNAEPESPIGQEARATGFANALARRPEMSL